MYWEREKAPTYARFVRVLEEDLFSLGKDPRKIFLVLLCGLGIVLCASLG